MYDTPEYQHLIQQHFLGLLSAEEELEFLKLMEDPEFQEAVRYHEQLHNTLEQKVQDHPLKQFLEQEEAFIQGSRILKVDETILDGEAAVLAELKRSAAPVWRSMAAAIGLILVSLSVLYYVNKGNTSQSPLAAQHSMQFDLDGPIAGKLDYSSKDNHSLFRPCSQLLFSEENCKGALSCLQNTIATNADQESKLEAKHLSAHCQFRAAKYEEAMHNYQQVINGIQDNRLKAEAEFNRLLIYLIQKDKRGLTEFQRLKNLGSTYLLFSQLNELEASLPPGDPMN